MARTQTQGVSAVTIWLIVFVFFWLVSTVWLVVLYTGQEELEALNTRLQRDNRQLVTAEQRNSIEYIKNLSDTGPTAVGLLEEARAETARLSTGEPKDAVAVVRTKRDELLQSIIREGLVDDSKSYIDAPLLRALTMLYENFKKVQELRSVAEERAAQLDAEVTRLVKLTADQAADFEKRAQELSDQVVTVEAGHTAYRTERDAAVGGLEQEFEQRRAQNTDDITKARQRAADAEAKLADLQARFIALQEKYGEVQIGPGKLSTVREPDGVILTAIPGDGFVYTNLGEKDRLTLGLRFAVYPADTGIPPDGRGKAQIEVVSISPSSSECKIINVARNDVIIEGDLIANPIYDPRHSPQFLVLGDFDLDRDGAVDPDGRANIEAMVRAWGGTVTTDVSATTDFVVLGAPPTKPRTFTNPTSEQAARGQAMQLAWDRYLNTLTTANGLGITILTQDRFLNYLGHTIRFSRN